LVGANLGVQSSLHIDGAQHLALFTNPPHTTSRARASCPCRPSSVGERVLADGRLLWHVLRPGVVLHIHADGAVVIAGRNMWGRQCSSAHRSDLIKVATTALPGQSSDAKARGWWGGGVGVDHALAGMLMQRGGAGAGVGHVMAASQSISVLVSKFSRVPDAV